MKRIIVLIVVAVVIPLMLCGESRDTNQYRLMDATQYHHSNNLTLRVTNLGYVGSGGNRPRLPSLEYPAASGIEHLFVGSLWVGGKTIRRDGEGRKLYWKPDPENQNDVVAEGTEAYQDLINEYGELLLVVDTLTTVGYDGDAHLEELLPAYNPLESYALGDQYEQYNNLDVVLRSIAGFPAPSDASFPNDESGTYAFFLPSQEQGDFPGLETKTAFYYDYSPFGTPGKRNTGSSAGQFDHYPLNLAVRQQTYAWTYEELYDMIFLSFDIHNTGADAIFDAALALYIDHDIEPEYWGQNLFNMNGYYAGEGYEFAYSYSFDPEDFEPAWMAVKLFPAEHLNRHSSLWTRGDGPDDRRPRSLTPAAGQITSNEKYWLMTGRNPDEEKFSDLRPLSWTPADNPHNEIEAVGDTRYLYSVFGDMNGMDDPSEHSLNIPAGGSVNLSGVIFFGDNLEQLKQRSIIAEEFFHTGYSLDRYQGVPFIPFIHSAAFADDAIGIHWLRAEEADAQSLMIKRSDQSSQEWQELELTSAQDSHIVNDLDPFVSYDLKIVAVYDDNTLESRVYQVVSDYSAVAEELLDAGKGYDIPMSNYPNPFNPDTRIAFYLDTPAEITLNIYNVKGQLVQTLINNEELAQGLQTVNWDGKDDLGREAPSGVYLYRLTTAASTSVRKMMLLK